MPHDYIQEMLDNNDENQVYQVFESHLVSRHAVSILLRKPFTKDDFDEFLEERKRTIFESIQTQLIEEKIKIPTHLKDLDAEIEEIEHSIRRTIIKTIGDEMDKYINSVPQHIQDNVQRRIDADIKKKTNSSYDDYKNFSKRIEFFDLREYQETIISKLNWEKFNSIFSDKQSLENRFNQLSTLRNGIRHSRSVSEIEQMDGEVAIKWFKTVLK
tara:strand:+ start:45 stop:686 length:642 start_codon:yes stop_codon:yes gene_type:complete